MVEKWYVYPCVDDGDEIGVKNCSYLFVALCRLMASSYEDYSNGLGSAVILL